MKVTPSFPVLNIYKDQGLDFFNEHSFPLEISVSSIVHQKPFEHKLYDSEGKLWSYRFINDRVKNDFITKWLSNTLYNPTVKVEVVWELLGTYNLTQLKSDILTCIDKDENILTQFEEGDFIKSEVEKCDNFEEIIFTLNKYVFDVNEEELSAEQSLRNR